LAAAAVHERRRITGSANTNRRGVAGANLRWPEVDLSTVRDTKSYFAKLVITQALNALRAGARRREGYVGPWLPEPLLDEQDPATEVVLTDSASNPILALLAMLGPDERAAFVLRELFGFNYGEIASAVGKSESAARQIAHRAHEHVQTRRQRFEPVDLRRRAEITAQFFGAAPTGDVQTLMTMLAHGAKNSSG
jgi:RNA polymerase sigma-70 factor (ECF subfamily)